LMGGGRGPLSDSWRKRKWCPFPFRSCGGCSKGVSAGSRWYKTSQQKHLC